MQNQNLNNAPLSVLEKVSQPLRTMPKRRPNCPGIGGPKAQRLERLCYQPAPVLCLTRFDAPAQAEGGEAVEGDLTDALRVNVLAAGEHLMAKAMEEQSEGQTSSCSSSSTESD